jgi:hypothetical protein
LFRRFAGDEYYCTKKGRSEKAGPRQQHDFGENLNLLAAINPVPHLQYAKPTYPPDPRIANVFHH